MLTVYVTICTPYKHNAGHAKLLKLKLVLLLTTYKSNGAVIGHFNPLTAVCKLTITTEKQTHNQDGMKVNSKKYKQSSHL